MQHKKKQKVALRRLDWNVIATQFFGIITYIKAENRVSAFDHVERENWAGHIRRRLRMASVPCLAKLVKERTYSTYSSLVYVENCIHSFLNLTINHCCTCFQL